MKPGYFAFAGCALITTALVLWLGWPSGLIFAGIAAFIAGAATAKPNRTLTERTPK